METKELQELAAKIVDEVDRKYGVNRDAQLSLSQLIEELGELARLLNLEKLRNTKARKVDLEDEFADVSIQLAKLAHLFDIDLEKAILNKIGTLKKRHLLKQA